MRTFKEFLNEKESITLPTLKNGLNKDSIKVMVMKDFHGTPQMTIDIPLNMDSMGGKMFSKINPPAKFAEIIDNDSATRKLADEVAAKIYDAAKEVISSADQQLNIEIEKILKEYDS